MLQDQGAIMRSGMAMLPDLAQQLLQQRLASLQERDVDLRERQFKAEERDVAQALERRGRFEQALVAAGSDPQKIARLMAAFPEYSEDLKRSFDAMDESQRNADVRVLSAAYQAAKSGNIASALDILRERQEAQLAVGDDDPGLRRVIQLLDSPNEQDRETAMGQLGVGIAAATGPDKFASVYGELFPSVDPTTLQREVEYLRSEGRFAEADQMLTNAGSPDLVTVDAPGFVFRKSDFANQRGGDPSGSRVLGYAGYQASVDALGPEGAAMMVQRNGQVVQVQTPEQAQALPAGVRYRTPDGREFVR